VAVRRPFTLLTVAATAAHHTFELAAGVGLVFQPFLGLGGALAYWGANLPVLAAAAARGSERWDGLLAYATGAGLSGAVVHFTIWPWSARRGLPLLIRAEGLSPGQLPAYNAVLYAWTAAAVLALLRETPRRVRPWAVAGLLGGVPLRWSARHHFPWASEQARVNPAWWNRGLQAP
jgi:hypothetical protein